MKQRPSKRIGVLIGLLAAATLLWLVSRPREANVVPHAPAEKAPFGEMERFVYTRTVGGEIKWQARAERALVYLDRQEVELTEPSGEQIDGDRVTTVRADTGTVNLDTRRGALTGKVAVESGDAFHFETDRLDFDAEARRAWTDDPVALAGPDFSVRGVGLQFDLAAQKASLAGPVAATIGGDQP